MAAQHARRSHQGEERTTDPLDAAVVGCLFRGGAIGLLVYSVPMAFVALPMALVPWALAIPLGFLQMLPMALAGHWFARRGRRMVALVLVAHLASAGFWALLWAGSEYGSVWLDVFRFLLAAQALPAAAQLFELRAHYRRAARAASRRRGSGG